MKTKLLPQQLTFRLHYLCLCSCFFLVSHTVLHAQQTALLDWATVQPSTTSGGSYAMTTDAAGNVYATGFFTGTTDFDPGPGTFNLTSVGGNNPFICKLDVNGNLVWVRLMAGVTTESGGNGQGIALDAAGNIYTTGGFTGTIDFDPGTGTFNLTAAPSTNSSEDVFISKLDNNGAFIWAKSFGDTSHESVAALSVDAAGSVYLTGRFVGTVDFDPSPGVFPLTPAYDYAMYIARFDTNGALTWAEQIGPTTNVGHAENPHGLTLDASGDIFITGTIFGNTMIDFDPGPGAFLVAGIGAHDIFILKLENDGGFAWVKTIRGSSLLGRSIAIANSGNVYVTGQFLNTVDFDPGPGVANLVSLGGSDPFVLKLDASGNYIWALNFTGGVVAGSDGGTRIAVDAAENVYTTGLYYGDTNDFDPGPGTYNLRSTTTFSSTFVSKLDVNGNFVWAAGMTGSNYTIPGGLSVHPSGNIYLSGYFHSRTDFDPGPCSYYLESPNSYYDIFVQKLKQGTPPIIPTFTSFSPASGPIGTTVTITGTNFSTTPSENQVLFFLNRPATVTAATETSLTVTVPTGTVTGPMVVTSRCVSMVSTTNFTVGAAVPTITGFTPASGAFGETVTITGANFSTTPGNNIVRFNGVQATVTASTATSIITEVPVGASTGKITVRVGTSTATSASDFTIIDCGEVPSIYSISPTSGVVGTPVTITGANFSSTLTDNRVFFNGVQAVVTASSGTSIVAEVPPGATPGDIAIQVDCHWAGTDGDVYFDVFAILAITTHPTDIAACEGDIVTLQAAATGASNISYQWLYSPDGNIEFENFSDAPGVMGAATSTLTINTTSVLGNGYFRCEIRGDLADEVESDIAHLSTVPKPAAPTVIGASACSGSTLTLNAAGASNGQYKWYGNATDAAPLPGEVNASYTTPELTETTVYYVTVTNNGCESLRTAVTATIAHAGCAPEISMASLATQPEGLIVIDLKPLISTTGMLDINSIKVAEGPPSGARTGVENGILTIDYSGIAFGGLESVTVEACNTNGHCGQQEFTIEVAGDIVVYNGISPNGDGKNETLIIQFIDMLPAARTNTVSVYNRWGDEVFSVGDYDNNIRVFSGRSNNGSQLPAGTYYYKIHFPLQRRTVTGYLSLKH